MKRGKLIGFALPVALGMVIMSGCGDTKNYTEIQPGQDGTFAVNEQTVRLLGRTYEKDGIRFFNWTDSGFEFRFEGTSVQAQLVSNKFDDDQDRTAFLDVFIDGREDPKDAITIMLDKEDGLYILAEGLKNGVHTCKVIKRTANIQGGDLANESISSTAGVKFLKIQGGKLYNPPGGKKRKLEFIGDSITVGMGILGDGRASSEDGWSTYAAYAARELNADMNVQAISGNGLICSVFGDKLFELPLEFPYTDKYNLGKVAWDFSSYQSDVVVINLGTNDYAGVGEGKKFTRQQFEDAYVDFLLQIKSKYPGCKVIGALGAMSESRPDDLFPQVEAAVKRANDKNGSTFAYSLRLEENQAEDGIGGGTHPTEKAHIKHAKALVKQIRQITGWK